MDIQGRIGVAVGDVGVYTHNTEMTVNDTAQSISISLGKQTLEVRHYSGNTIYYGSAGVTAANGFPVYEREWRVWNNVETTFEVYFVCSNGQAAKLRVGEYE